MTGFNLGQSTYHVNVLYVTGKSMKVDKEFAAEATRISVNDYYIDYKASERFIRVYTSFPGTRDWLESSPKKYFFFSFIQIILWLTAILGLLKLDSDNKIIISVCLSYSIFFNCVLTLLSRYIIHWLPIVLVLSGFYFLTKLEESKFLNNSNKKVLPSGNQ